MTTHGFLTIAALAVAASSLPAAQHEGHQMPAPLPARAGIAECVRAQPAVQKILAAAATRLESARQSNSPAEMRAAIDAMDGILRDLRTELAPCVPAAPGPHDKHSIPGTPPPGA
jgi:hypothetical protein